MMDEVRLKKYWIDIPKARLGLKIALPPSPSSRLQSETHDTPKTSYRKGIVKLKPAINNKLSPNSTIENKRKVLKTQLSAITENDFSPKESKPSSKLIVNASLKRIFQNVSKRDNFKESNLLSDHDVSPSSRKLIEKKSTAKVLSGRMFASELWGKKQHEEALTASPVTARNVSYLKYRLAEKQPTTPLNEIALRRKIKNDISDEIIKKYNSGSRLSYEDVTVQPPLYDQLVSQRQGISPRTKLKLPINKASRQASFVSVRDTTFTSNENESRRDSKSPMLLSLTRELSSPISFSPYLNSNTKVARKRDTIINNANYGRSSLLDINNSMNQKNPTAPKEHSLLLKVTKSSTTEDYHPSDSLRKKSSLAIHETLAHLDTIIDECNQISSDQTLTKALSKFDDVTYSEREKSFKRQNTRFLTQKNNFIESYSHQIKARNKKD